MTLSPFLRLSLCVAAGFFTSVADAQQVQYSHGDPSALEQQMVELVNRARMNPAQEGVILDSVNTWYSNDARARKPSFFTNLRAEFASYPAVPPLAFNPKLTQAARSHSLDMITRNFFSHVNPSGQDPTARAAAVGYDTGVGENIDGGGATSQSEIEESHFGFMVDYDNIDLAHPLGHRINALNADYTEIGVGMAGARYGGKLTQDFGAPARNYITGVAYMDSNANGSYDVGEGLAGIVVKPDIGNWFAVTSNSGGFAIPIDPVETVSDRVNVPFPVQTTPWSTVQPYDTAYRQQQIAAAPNMTVNLTWTGGPLSISKTTSVTIKRPVLRNYRIVGTDGWAYTFSMVTSQNAKADLRPTAADSTPPLPSAPFRDFNADGKADLLFQNAFGQIVLWRMNGAGAIASSAFIFSGGLGDWRLAGTADLNRDGNPDLILQNNFGQIVAWYVNSSGGVTSGAFICSSGLGDWRVMAAADLNGDGNADLILQNNFGQIVAWYMNSSGGVTSGAFICSSGLGDWRVRAVVDVNGDGYKDVILQNNFGQIAAWYLNAGGTVAFSSFIYAGGLGDWKLSAVADLNSDGNADLIFQNSAGQITAWYMNGRSSYSGTGWISTVGLGDWRVR